MNLPAGGVIMKVTPERVLIGGIYLAALFAIADVLGWIG